MEGERTDSETEQHANHNNERTACDVQQEYNICDCMHIRALCSGRMKCKQQHKYTLGGTRMEHIQFLDTLMLKPPTKRYCIWTNYTVQNEYDSEDNENLRFLTANVAPATITVIAHEDERGDQRREQGVIRSQTGGSESWASPEHKHHSKRHQFLTNLALPSAQSFERLLHSILRPALRSGATENLGNNGRNGFELHVC